MTCIVGIVHEGRVYLGADSLGTGDCGAVPEPPEITKVFRLGSMVVACAGEPRVQQIIQFILEEPCHEDDNEPAIAYMVRRFIPALRAALEAGGVSLTPDKAGSPWSLLVGYRGQLFAVYDDFQVDMDARGYMAKGCGREWALGSLHTSGQLAKVWLNPTTRLLAALEAAAEHDIHVAPPFVTLDSGS